MRNTLAAAVALLLIAGGLLNAQELAPPVPPPTTAAPAVDDEQLPGTQRVWFATEFLAWWFRDAPVVPLVTVGNPGNAAPGAIGQSGTVVAVGANDIDLGTFGGVRLMAGTWFTPDRNIGVEVGGFMLEKRSAIFQVTSDSVGKPLIARPFINATTHKEAALFDSFPFFETGTAVVTGTARLQGLEGNLALVAFTDATIRVDLLAGYRGLDLNESLEIDDAFASLSPGFLTFLNLPADAPNTLFDYDRFHTSNKFNGGQVGGRVDWRPGPFVAGLSGKLALGSTEQIVTIDGASSLVSPTGAATTVAGGVLAQKTNIGHYSRSEFSVVSEIGANIGLELADWLETRIGYTFMYWSHVARPGAQIDRNVNPALVPTVLGFSPTAGGRPTFAFADSDLRVQGVSITVAVKY